MSTHRWLRVAATQDDERFIDDSVLQTLDASDDGNLSESQIARGTRICVRLIRYAIERLASDGLVESYLDVTQRHPRHRVRVRLTPSDDAHGRRIKRRVELRMPDDLLTRLDIRAAREHVTRTSLVDAAIERYLEES